MLKMLADSSRAAWKENRKLIRSGGLERKDGAWGWGTGEEEEQREQGVDACTELFGIMAHRKERRDYLECRRRRKQLSKEQ